MARQGMGLDLAEEVAHESHRKSDIRDILANGIQQECDLEDAVVASVASRIQVLVRASTVDFSIQLGELISREIFHGSHKLIENEGQQNRSFRKLAAHPSVPFGPSTLWRAVQLYKLMQATPELRQLEHLSIVHFRAVIGLSVESQARLLRQASAERWNRNQIEEAAFSERAAFAGRGRKRVPKVLRAARCIQRMLTKEMRAESLINDSIDCECAREATEILRCVRLECENIERQLQSRITQSG